MQYFQPNLQTVSVAEAALYKAEEAMNEPKDERCPHGNPGACQFCDLADVAKTFACPVKGHVATDVASLVNEIDVLASKLPEGEWFIGENGGDLCFETHGDPEDDGYLGEIELPSCATFIVALRNAWPVLSNALAAPVREKAEEPSDEQSYLATLQELLTCACSWEGEVRLLGNIRAADMVQALMFAIDRASPKPSEPSDKWRKALEAGVGADGGHGFECRLCRATMNVDFGEEPTTLCHSCAQDFVEEHGLPLLVECDSLKSQLAERTAEVERLKGLLGAPLPKMHVEPETKPKENGP